MERYGQLERDYDQDEVNNFSYNSLTNIFASTTLIQAETDNKENSLQDSNKFSSEFASKQSKNKKTVQVSNPSLILFTH